MFLVPVVIDTSVFADYYLFYPSKLERHRRARNIIKKISGMGNPVYEPFLFEIEMRAVLVRGIDSQRVLEIINTLLDHINIVEEKEIHDKAAEIALLTGCRAIDAYYIATAKYLDAILVTSDRIMRENARKTHLKAYYILDDKDYDILVNDILEKSSR